MLLAAAIPLRADLVPTQTATACTKIVEAKGTDDNVQFLFSTYSSATVMTVGCHCIGTCTPTMATFALEDRAGNPMTHDVPTCSTGTQNTSYTPVTAENQLELGEAAAFDITNTPDPLTDTYILCVTFTHSSN